MTLTPVAQRPDAPGVVGPRAPEATSDALLRQVAAGDELAFERLYDQLGAAVFGLCLRVLRDRDHAAEVAQEVWLGIWRDAARFDPARGSARAWALTAAHRRAVDRVRAVQSQRDRDQRDFEAEPGRPFDEVADEVADDLERARVRDCLDALTETQRRAVVLAYYGGRTYREVAVELGAALPTVKSRIRDGLVRLRTCLGVTA